VYDLIKKNLGDNLCSVLLIRRQCEKKDSCFDSSLPSQAVRIAVLKDASFHSLCCLMDRKVKSFKQCFYRNSVRCQKLQVFKLQSFGLDTGLNIALSIIRCSKSAQNFAARVCQVAVVMETVQLVLSQFKNFTVVNCESSKVSRHQKN